MGAIRPLVFLCNGPDGPLPDLEAKAAAQAEAGEETVEESGGEKKKKKAKKPKKKKKGKLEAGERCLFEGWGRLQGHMGAQAGEETPQMLRMALMLIGPQHVHTGMAEAQTFGSAVLRLISLDDAWRVPLARAGVVRYLLPLLDAKLSPARWNARQVCS